MQFHSRDTMEVQKQTTYNLHCQCCLLQNKNYVTFLRVRGKGGVTVKMTCFPCRKWRWLVAFVCTWWMYAMIKPFGLALRMLFLLQYDLILKKISSRKTLKSSNFMTSYFESRAAAAEGPPLFLAKHNEIMVWFFSTCFGFTRYVRTTTPCSSSLWRGCKKYQPQHNSFISTSLSLCSKCQVIQLNTHTSVHSQIL